MMYVSTRGEAPALGFEDVLLTGLGADGGLYVPEVWPCFSRDDIAAMRGLPYEALALRVLAPFTGGALSERDLARLLHDAYATFSGPAIAPLRQTGDDRYILELFHGPTLAFKDFAMQVLARLMDQALARRRERTAILGATSGDTGAAAVEAFRGRAEIDVFVLFPQGRVSDIQRRQMTTADDANVHAIAIEGTFDDAQAIVKTLFNDRDFRRQHRLSAINSINWARIMAQTVYYFSAALELGAPDKAVSFSVPTGNFGDVFAGYAASRMGLAVDKLIVATNENDILARALASGVYEPRGVVATDSPSMDIQVSSNFERLMFEASGRDAAFVRDAMARLASEGRFDLPEPVLGAMRAQFIGQSATREEAAAALRQLHDRTGYLIDPHTAVGLAAADSVEAAQGKLASPIVVLGTAHPAKFPDAVMRAAGQRPDIPCQIERILTMKEHYAALPNSAAAVAGYMTRHSRFTALAHHQA
jgi:threonine synthase